jgi:siroheme synthase-like protein
MKLLPVALNIENKPCLIVGGGAVARRKAESLLECGAKVHVIAPQLCDEFESLMNSLEYSKRGYQSGDCKNYSLVFACTDNRELNAAVAEEAKGLSIWCNIGDDNAGSDFHVAAAIRRGDVCVGITTGGGSPALSRHLKAKVQEAIGPEYSELLEIISARRDALSRSTPEQKQRAAIWRAILESDALELLRSGQREAAEAVVDGLCNPSREK